MPLRFAPTGEVVVHEEEGDAFLLHVASGQYYGLNRSGLVIWNSLVKGSDPLDELTQRWPNRTRQQLQADTETLIADLVRAGILSEVGHD
jgi:hypothetical protein